MRVNQPKLTPGSNAMIGDHAVAVASDGEAGITFGAQQPTTGEAARINAALAGSGMRVAKYWKSGTMAVQTPPTHLGGRNRRIVVAPGTTVSSRRGIVSANISVPGVPMATCLSLHPDDATRLCFRAAGHGGSDHTDGTGMWPAEAMPTAAIGTYAYNTWSGHRVILRGSPAYAYAGVSLASNTVTAEDRTRLNTALAGWGLAIIMHPRTKTEVIEITPARTGGRRQYKPLVAGKWYYGDARPVPAGAMPYAGVQPSDMVRPACGSLSTGGGIGLVCGLWPSHLGDHHVRTPEGVIGAGWPSAATVAAANAAATIAASREAMGEYAEATDEATEVEPERDDELPMGAHVYVPQPGLVERFDASLRGMREHNRVGPNFLFLGPSGSGKGDGAAFLAARAGLPFTKIDAASVTEPEAWFGTREVVERNGTSVTEYRESSLVESVQRPGVTFVDEITRARTVIHNIFLPLLDGTRRVTNPLNGAVIERHPENVIILAANRGLEYTGTFDLDPALTSRVRTINFDYPPTKIERRILRQASGCSDVTARIIVAFATETRKKAKQGVIGIAPMSVRECIAAACDVADGLDTTLAVESAYIAVRPDDGGAASAQQVLRDLWTGLTPPTDDEV